MEQAFGSGIQAGPYLWMAFGGGAALMFSYLGWLIWDRQRLRQLLVAINSDSKN